MTTRHGNYQKYLNPNPLQRWLIGRFLRRVERWVADLPLHTLLDAGTAEGFVSRHLAARYGESLQIVGIDLDLAALFRGRELFPAMARLQGDVTQLPFLNAQFDLVMCTEVLEHLPEPAFALRELSRLTKRYCLLSVPHEPWFRLMNFLRGKHVRHFGNDPEHLQNWTLRSFRDFVGTEFSIVRSASVLPWSLVLAEKRQGYAHKF